MSRPLLVLLLVLPPLACERPTGPGLREIMARVPDFTLDAGDDHFGTGSFYDVAGLRQMPHSDFIVEHDGEAVRYLGLVFERHFVPDTGHGGNGRIGRRILLAWRADEPRERIAVVTGPGHTSYGSLRLPRTMEEANEVGDWPTWIGMRWSDGQSWKNHSGQADFNFLGEAGECMWHPQPLPPELVPLFRCASAEYSVFTHAVLKSRTGGGARTGILIRPQTVKGIRMTIQCDGSAVARELDCGS